MRALALVPIACLLAGCWSPAEAATAERDGWVRQQFAERCGGNGRNIAALTTLYGVRIVRGDARIDRALWTRMNVGERDRLRWTLAYSASCAAGHPGTHKVRLFDRAGRLIAWQIISTELSPCGGDHAAPLRPDEVERPC